MSTLVNIFPSNLWVAFSSANMLQVIVIAVFFGGSIMAAGEKGNLAKDIVSSFYAVIEKLMTFIIGLSPIGVFTYMAWVVATQGPAIVGDLAIVILCVLGYRYSENPLLNRLMEFIDQHYAQELHLSDCAKALATSESNVARLFRKYLNTSFSAYYNEVRINKAKALLAGGHPIKEAAAMVGYNNLNYFYRIFKAQLGVTPREYLNQNEQ